MHNQLKIINSPKILSCTRRIWIFCFSAIIIIQNPLTSGAQTQKLQVPNSAQLNILIRSTIQSLNDANLTGNYTVFRDLAAPNFRNSNSAAKISTAFTDLRNRNIDLSPIIIFKTQLTKQPTVDKNGLLRLTGYFPTQPEQVNFDLAYQFVGNRWRIFGLAVNTSMAPRTLSSKIEDEKDKSKKKNSKSSSKNSKNSQKKTAKQVPPKK